MRVEGNSSVGHPVRTQKINQHIGGLLSGVDTKISKAAQGLKAMKLSPAERRYVQIESARPPKQNPAVAAQYRKAHPQGEPSVGPYKGPGRPAKVSPLMPILGYSSQQLHHLGRSEKQLGNIKKGLDKQNAEYAAMIDPYSHENLAFDANAAWQMTGIPTLEHPIRSGPLGDAMALGGLLPFGKIASLGKLGEITDAAKAGETAAKDVAGTGRVSKALAARRAAKLARRGPQRTEEQAAQHVLATAKRAKQQGFGRMLPKVPEVKPGELTAETGGQAGKIVRQGLHPTLKGLGRYEKVGAQLDNPGLTVLRNEQETARAIERSRRAGAIERAAAGKSGLARHVAAKAALEGGLPKGEFKGFAGLTPELRDQAINHIYEHPHFQPFEKVRTSDALDEAIAGKVPTKGDQKLLERAFGKEQAAGLVASVKQGGFRQALVNILGVPRSLMASGDISAPFRQGLVVMASHPKLFFSEFRPMIQSLRSEDQFQGLMRGIHTMPTFPMMEKAKLALTDIGATARGAENLSAREEQFVSNLAEQIPGVGRVVRGSDRAYVGFLNKTRADLFNTLVHQAASEGYHLNDKLLEDIAKFVNSATGRGSFDKLATHMTWMNVLFFSPRLLASRLNFLNPIYYARLSPFARVQALKAAGRLAGTLSLILYTAKLAGAQVNTDPRNADFGKIRIGNTRIDIAAGFQQPLRLAAQLATGEIVSSTTGRLEHLTGGFAGSSRLDVLQQFGQSKLAPVPGAITDILKGQQFSGQPLDFSPNPLDTNSEVTGHLVPLAWQDAINTAQQTHSKLGGAAGGLLSATGIGVQSYSPQAANSPQKTQEAEKKALTLLQKQEAVLKVPAQWRRVYAKGVKVEVQRDLAKRQARKLSQSGKISEAQSYKITMRTLRNAGMMTAAQYKQAVGAAGRMNKRELEHWEYEAWYHLGPGLLLEKLHHYYNVKTGQ